MTKTKQNYTKPLYIDTLMFVEERRKSIFQKGEGRLFDFEVVSMFNKLLKENEQLRKQIKVFDLFLEGNNLDIDWNELCILDSCIMNDEIECRDCIYMGMDVLE